MRLAAVLVAASVGCRSGSGTSGPPAGTPIPLGDLCSVFTDDLCIYLMQCNGARYRDMDHCRAELDCFGLAELTASAMQGGVIYDPSQVGACHARFLSDPCNFAFFLFTPDIFEVLADCPGTITPQRRQGEACVSNGECTAGLYCQKPTSTCPGSCVPFAQNGEACPTSVRCAPGLFCTGGVCRPYAKAGDTCASSSDCGPITICINSPTCVDENLWCDVGAGVCKAGGGAGAACGPISSPTGNSQAQCANGFWCDNVPFTASGTCRATGGGAGSPCSDTGGGCAQGLHCAGYVATGTGAKLGTCAAGVAAGGTCNLTSDCQTGLRCIGGTCSPPAAFGSACTADADCQKDLTCSSLRCIHARYPGDACGDADSVCVLSLCRDGVCRDHAKVGQPCTVAGDCTTGACAGGKCVDTSVCPP